MVRTGHRWVARSSAAAGTRGQDAAQAEGGESQTSAQEIRFTDVCPVACARPRTEDCTKCPGPGYICPRHRGGWARGYQELFALVTRCASDHAGVALGPAEVPVFRVVVMVWAGRALGGEPRYWSPSALRIMMRISLFLIRLA